MYACWSDLASKPIWLSCLHFGQFIPFNVCTNSAFCSRASSFKNLCPKAILSNAIIVWCSRLMPTRYISIIRIHRYVVKFYNSLINRFLSPVIWWNGLDLLQNFSKNPPSTNRILRIVIPIRTHEAHCYSVCKNSIPVQYRKVGELALVLKKMDNTKYNRITGNAMPNANKWPMHQAKRKPRLHTTPPKNGAKCAWNRISN
jgi:hypothetical protein